MKKSTLRTLRADIIRQFRQGEPVARLMQQTCQCIDQLIAHAWQAQRLDQTDNLCILALGSYGRNELHLHSDIDLLILSAEHQTDITRERIAHFVRYLWDSDLEVGHSVRTLLECIDIARRDITVLTNLTDARLLQGSQSLFTKLTAALQASDMWPGAAFLRAKWKEQLYRHKKYAQTAYNLEPNIKYSPGGLRDLQLLAWLAKRHFNSEDTGDLVKQQLLTAMEYAAFIKAREFLWRVRFALHIFAGKREDRLLFDYQTKIAKLFGYQDSAKQLAIEQFMHDYFRSINTLNEINDMVLQSFRALLFSPQQQHITPLNQHFQICNRNIEVCHQKIFAQHPDALLEIFLLMAQHPNIRAVSAATIRLIHQHKHLIDDQFRSNPDNRKLFIRLLSHNKNLAKQLQLMDRYGILGLYIPEFGKIVGQMQYDLFHAYTVDQHTIFVIRNLNRFTLTQFSKQFPLCITIMRTIEKPELLYIAALFHDIAKGRGGDHSELGAQDVVRFCLHHGFTDTDTELVAWLVKHHLLLSLTAQRKDIHDPETIQQFSQQLGNKNRLDHLYLLTVADICATNPALWNGWKHALLTELYKATVQLMTTKHMGEKEIIAARKTAALEYLMQHGINKTVAEKLWDNFKNSYFLHAAAKTIAQHTVAILQHDNKQEPLILTILHHTHASTEIFIHMPDHKHRFAITTTVLANHQLNILEAHINTTRNGYSLDSYIVLDPHQQPITNTKLLQQIKTALSKSLRKASSLPHLIPRKVSRRKQHFKSATQIQFQENKQRQRTMLSLISPDRPSLLAQISKAFVDCNIRLQTAKITTFDDRVEDIFYITDQNNQAITDVARQEQIRQTIRQYLD